MKPKNLAYIALLAGWICFCYWLYAEGISPRLHPPQEKSWPQYSETLSFPLAYAWSSDLPLSGPGFGELKSSFTDLDSTDEVVIIQGYYFRDEAADPGRLKDLAFRRIQNALGYLDLPANRYITQVSVQEITSDVKAHPFEAVKFERISIDEIVRVSNDTFELCFPLKDSLSLPPVCTQRFESWIKMNGQTNNQFLHIVGTADGSGIAEPADRAMDRALEIKKLILDEGWKDDQLIISTGQRNHPLTLRNRCVVLYFE